MTSDTERLDFLEQNAGTYGYGWKCRLSTTGRGIRLHQSTWPGSRQTVREAIDDFIAEMEKRDD